MVASSTLRLVRVCGPNRPVRCTPPLTSPFAVNASSCNIRPRCTSVRPASRCRRLGERAEAVLRTTTFCGTGQPGRRGAAPLSSYAASYSQLSREHTHQMPRSPRPACSLWCGRDTSVSNGGGTKASWSGVALSRGRLPIVLVHAPNNKRRSGQPGRFGGSHETRTDAAVLGSTYSDKRMSVPPARSAHSVPRLRFRAASDPALLEAVCVSAPKSSPHSADPVRLLGQSPPADPKSGCGWEIVQPRRGHDVTQTRTRLHHMQHGTTERK
jgi:hypothetical protein